MARRFVWRGVMLIAGCAVVVVLIVTVVLRVFAYKDKQELGVIMVTMSLLVNLFYVYPLLVRMAMRKQFKGFRLEVLRQDGTIGA